MPRSRPHRCGRRGGDEFPLERHVPEGNSALHVARLRTGSYDANYERKGQDYPLPYVRWTENRNMEEFLRLSRAGESTSTR